MIWATLNSCVCCYLLALGCLLPLAVTPAEMNRSSRVRASLPSLEEVVDRVRFNEEKLSLIKMRFSADFTSEGQVPDYRHISPRAGGKVAKKRHTEVEWAQDGVRQRYIFTTFDGDELTASGINVIDGEVWKCGDLPELKHGRIRHMSEYENKWKTHYASMLYYRPLMSGKLGTPLLSEGLASSKLAREITIEKLEDHEVYVLDFKAGASTYRRFYVDVERGLLLRSVLYSGFPYSERSKLHGSAELTKIHELDNGGWVGAEGVYAFYGDGFAQYVHVRADVNSISVDRADIPDTLFQLEFPAHTLVSNDIVGIATRGNTDRVARQLIDEINKATEQTSAAEVGAQHHGAVQDAGPNRSEQGLDTAIAIAQKEQHGSGSDTDGINSGDRLGWAQGARQLGVLLLVTGATAFLLMMRRKGKA